MFHFAHKSKFIILNLLFLGITASLKAQIPENTSYTQIYEFLDEMASEHLIEINSTVKPYTRTFIAEKLREVKQDSTARLSKRQQKELDFYLNEYALECDTIPTTLVHWTNHETFDLGLLSPGFQFRQPKKNKRPEFTCRIVPILGMDVYANKNGAITKRWYGADIQMTIADHVAIWGSLRDNSWNTQKFVKKSVFEGTSTASRLITQPQYLNNLPGMQRKEANYGGDYSDCRGGIQLYNRWGSIGIKKDELQLGEAYHCSNILSGRAPTYPMLTYEVHPTRWFSLNYAHAWLVSNVLDSTDYYVENQGTEQEKKHFRTRNKYMAITMASFMPIPQLNISFGNAVIYAEKSANLGYFMPFAFYKSIDHQFTKGVSSENQNSMMFASFSTRNLKHVKFYGSVYIDEFKFSRLKKSDPAHNPISWQLGARLSNWPVRDIYLTAEYTRSNIINYKHSIEALSYTSNSYCLGHYMGDNSDALYTELAYKPIKNLRVALAYTLERKGNDYDYLRARDITDINGNNVHSAITNIISQKTMKDIIYRNHEVKLTALYEVFSHIYAHLDITYNKAQGFDATGDPIPGERLNTRTAQGALDAFCPRYLQGENITLNCGLTFNF